MKLLTIFLNPTHILLLLALLLSPRLLLLGLLSTSHATTTSITTTLTTITTAASTSSPSQTTPVVPRLALRDLLPDEIPECGRPCLLPQLNATNTDTDNSDGDENSKIKMAAPDKPRRLCEHDIDHYLTVLRCVRARCSLEESMGAFDPFPLPPY